MLKALSHYRQGMGDTGRSDIFAAWLHEPVKHSPGDSGYQRFRWSGELQAIKIREVTCCPLHASPLRRGLPAAGRIWCRAAPALRIRAPNKEEKNGSD